VFGAAFIDLYYVFVIFWQKSIGAKAAHEMLMKLSISSMFYEQLLRQ